MSLLFSDWQIGLRFITMILFWIDLYYIGTVMSYLSALRVRQKHRPLPAGLPPIWHVGGMYALTGLLFLLGGISRLQVLYTQGLPITVSTFGIPFVTLAFIPLLRLQVIHWKRVLADEQWKPWPGSRGGA